MSNIFKINSRFSVLVDDTPQQKYEYKKDKEQKMKFETSKDKRFNSFKSEPKRDHYISKKELEEKEKERIMQEALNIENFPDLVTVHKKESTENNKISYASKIKKDDVETKPIDPDLNNLNLGWCLLKKDPFTKKTIIKHHPETNVIKNFKADKLEDKQEITTDILTDLIELHKKRTNDYIENYGYDEWEKMFKFNDWRECEAYLEKMEETEEETEEETDESDYHDE